MISTIGHSTRAFEEFLAILQAHGIEHLIDVRTVPKSRRYPHFNTDALAAALGAAGITYEHVPALGGWRKPRPDSRNSAWKNDSFRGYADYMETGSFQEALEALIRRGEEKRAAYMCAEAMPYRCHRSLVSDALQVRGVEVRHLTSKTRSEPHRLTPFARVEDGRVSYPGLL